jgi:hypothetical protein
LSIKSKLKGKFQQLEIKSETKMDASTFTVVDDGEEKPLEDTSARFGDSIKSWFRSSRSTVTGGRKTRKQQKKQEKNRKGWFEVKWVERTPKQRRGVVN